MEKSSRIQSSILKFIVFLTVYERFLFFCCKFLNNDSLLINHSGRRQGQGQDQDQGQGQGQDHEKVRQRSALLQLQMVLALTLTLVLTLKLVQDSASQP